jgi:hypothetical protein
MNAIDAKALHSNLTATITSLKAVLSTENSDGFVLALYEDSRLLQKIETALFYEDLVLSELEDNLLIAGLFKELRSCYISLLFLIQADAYPSLKTKGDPFSKLFLRTDQAINVKPKLVGRFQEKFDFFHIALVFKQYFTVRRVEELEGLHGDQDKIGRILRFFVPLEDMSFTRLYQQVRKTLNELEEAGLVHEGFVFFQNNLPRFLACSKTMVQYIELVNFLALFCPEFARVIIVQHDAFKSFVSQLLFYSIETSDKYEQLRHQLESMDSAYSISLDELLFANSQIKQLIIALIDNVCLLQERSFGTGTSLNTSKVEKMVKKFFADSFKPFLESFYNKLNDNSVSRVMIVRGIKYVIRNCKNLRSLNEIIKGVAFKDSAVDPLVIRTKDFFKVKVKNELGKNTATPGHISSRIPKEDELDEKHFEKEAQKRKEEDEIQTMLHLNNIVQKLNQDKEFQSEQKSFKLMDEYNDMMYDDEYDDTFDGNLFSLGNNRDESIEDDADDVDAADWQSVKQEPQSQFPSGNEPRTNYSGRGSDRGRGRGRGQYRGQNSESYRGRRGENREGFERNGGNRGGFRQQVEHQPREAGSGRDRATNQKSEMEDLYVRQRPDENRFRKKDQPDQTDDNNNRGRDFNESRGRGQK